MRLEEWVKTVTDELVAAGFHVNSHGGFPLVPVDDVPDRLKILKFNPSVRCHRMLASEGMLFTPPRINIS